MHRRNKAWAALSLLLVFSLSGLWASTEQREAIGSALVPIIQPILLTPMPVTFVVTSDNRGYPGFSDVLDEIKRLAAVRPIFMASAGDLDPPSVTRTQLDAAFGADFQWIPVVGNHEISPSTYMSYLRTYYEEHLEGRVRPGPAGSEETTYSFDLGPVHLVVLNEYFDGTSDVGTDGDVVPELLSWLADDLSNTDKTWKVVFGHEPAFPQPDETYGTSRHVGDSLDAYPTRRDNFWQLLDAHNVQAYVCGHTHSFSRYQPPGSQVWQIDAGQAREIGDYDTFLLFTADEESLRIDICRSLGETQFSKFDTMVLSKPEEARLPSPVSATGR